MNLYASSPSYVEEISTVCPSTLYTERVEQSLSSESSEMKIITVLTSGFKKLWIISYNGFLYLTDKFSKGIGVANILYSSKSLRRVTNYGQQLIKTL